MNILDILKEKLIGRQLLSVGKKVFKNARIVDIDSISGWEQEGEFYHDSGVKIDIQIECDYQHSKRLRNITIAADAEFVLEYKHEPF